MAVKIASDKYAYLRPKWLRGLSHSEAERQLAYVVETIKELRKSFKGFEASEGYDLREPTKIHPAKIKRVLDRGPYVHLLKARPHLTYTPRTPKARKAVRRHTGQTEYGDQKTYFVHTTSPEKKKFRVTKTGRPEIRQEIIDDETGESFELVDRYYYFPERAMDWDDVIAMTKEAIRYLPDGHYCPVTETAGDISVPHPKKELVNMMRRWHREYSPIAEKEKFPLAIIGFRFMGSTQKDAILQYRQRETQRQIYQRERKKELAREQRLAVQRLSPQSRRRVRTKGRL